MTRIDDTKFIEKIIVDQKQEFAGRRLPFAVCDTSSAPVSGVVDEHRSNVSASPFAWFVCRSMHRSFFTLAYDDMLSLEHELTLTSAGR